MPGKTTNKSRKIVRKHRQIDASGRPLGRLASEIAILLRGKNKPNFETNQDCGDFVEVANCQKIKFTGKKLNQKEYLRHSNYPGGLKRRKMSEVFAKNPEKVLERAVWGMLPKNRLRTKMFKRLKITK